MDYYSLPSFLSSSMDLQLSRVGQQLEDASASNDLDALKALQRDNPAHNLEERDGYEQTLLNRSCCEGRLEVVKLLLANPGIDVNSKDICRRTGFYNACDQRHLLVVRLLLRDPRVDVTRIDFDRRSPAWNAAADRNDDIITEFMASGRDFGDFEERSWKGSEYGTLWKIASDGIVERLSNYLDHPKEARFDACWELGLLSELAAEFFALIVFLCDDFLQLKPDTAAANATRFFTIAKRLPMELQMIFCNRVTHSAKDNILSTDFEPAFKYLAMRLLLPLEPHQDPF